MKKLNISTVAKFAIVDQLDVPEQDQTVLYLEGYASVNRTDSGDKNVDRDNEVYDIPSLSIDNYKKNGPIVFNHDWNIVLGKATHVEKTIKGLFVKAELHKVPGHEDIFYGVQKGLIKAFSINAIPKSYEYLENEDALELQDAELVEISVLSVPSNAQSLFNVTRAKSLTVNAEEVAEQNQMTLCELKGLCGLSNKSITKEKGVNVDTQKEKEEKVVEAEPKEAEPKEAEPKEAEPKEAEPKEASSKEAKPAVFDEAALVAAIEKAEVEKARLATEKEEAARLAAEELKAQEEAAAKARVENAISYIKEQREAILTTSVDDFDLEQIEDFYSLMSDTAEAIEEKVVSLVKEQTQTQTED